jgi:hypothetical protein
MGHSHASTDRGSKVLPLYPSGDGQIVRWPQRNGGIDVQLETRRVDAQAVTLESPIAERRGT